MLALLISLTGCASANDDPPAPAACQKTDRNGTYRLSFQLQGGNCGELADQIVSFDAPNAGAGAGGKPRCVVTSERWTENDCKLATTTTCSDSGGTSTSTYVTRQQTQDGSSIAGAFSVSVRLSDGASCSGTYGITAVRQ